MSCFVCFLIYFNHYKDSKQIEYKYLGTFICGADVGDDATIVTLYASKKQKKNMMWQKNHLILSRISIFTITVERGNCIPEK